MKQYSNGMKATEFTKRQIGVIYRLAKNQELKVEKWVMSNLYDKAEYYGYDDNRSVEWDEMKIKDILNAVFAKDIEKAQTLIDEYTSDVYDRTGLKIRKSFDRNMVA